MFRIFDVHLTGKDQPNSGGMRIGGIYPDYCKKFVMYTQCYLVRFWQVQSVWVCGCFLYRKIQMHGDVCNFNNSLFLFTYDNIKLRYIGLGAYQGPTCMQKCNFYEVIVSLIRLFQSMHYANKSISLKNSHQLQLCDILVINISTYIHSYCT